MTSENETPAPIAELPESGVLLGIDYGTKRVGVAVSDRDQKFSSPLYNHQRQGVQGDTRFFRQVVEEYGPVGIVVGLPLHLSGDESEKSREARRFAEWLSQMTGLPHGFQDERFSSFQAERLMTDAALTKKQRKDRIDKLAAQILLQTFLEGRLKAKLKPPIVQAEVDQGEMTSM
jgi:putative Holliday junction resolvase